MTDQLIAKKKGQKISSWADVKFVEIKTSQLPIFLISYLRVSLIFSVSSVLY